MSTNDSDELERHAKEFSVDAPGAEELQVIPWPLLLHRQLTTKVEAGPRYPWIVLTTALFGLFSEEKTFVAGPDSNTISVLANIIAVSGSVGLAGVASVSSAMALICCTTLVSV